MDLKSRMDTDCCYQVILECDAMKHIQLIVYLRMVLGDVKSCPQLWSTEENDDAHELLI